MKELSSSKAFRGLFIPTFPLLVCGKRKTVKIKQN